MVVVTWVGVGDLCHCYTGGADTVLCTNMWPHQSKAFVCHHQSSQPMPKGFQSKVEKWPGL